MTPPPPSTTPHELSVAPRGCGKGVGVVLPSLLAFAGPVVVLDVKGESLRQAARPRGHTDSDAESRE